MSIGKVMTDGGMSLCQIISIFGNQIHVFGSLTFFINFNTKELSVST